MCTHSATPWLGTLCQPENVSHITATCHILSYTYPFEMILVAMCSPDHLQRSTQVAGHIRPQSIKDGAKFNKRIRIVRPCACAHTVRCHILSYTCSFEMILVAAQTIYNAARTSQAPLSSKATRTS